MATVTDAAKRIEKPGRYITISQFSKHTFDDGLFLNEIENVNPSIIGTSVEYLTRFLLNHNVIQSFEVPIRGYRARLYILSKVKPQKMVLDDDKEKGTDIMTLTNNIKGLDDNSIISACKCAAYDVWYRNPKRAVEHNYDVLSVKPDADTIQNIRLMVNRSLDFWKEYGPVVSDGFNFNGENGNSGYTRKVDAGDGDFLTEDTIWDFKVIKKEPDTVYAVQLLLYWIMSQHTWSEKFRKVSKIGIYNPRLNKAYILPIALISNEAIRDIEDNIIGYNNNEFKFDERIRHEYFGEGTVISASPLGNDTLLEISFDESGTKKLAAKFAKITKI